MKKGPYHGLQDFFGMPLIQKAEELGYSPDNILVLKGRMDVLKKEYPEIYNNIYTCVHNRDKRTHEEYAKDLVASWLFEDYIVNMIKNADFDVVLSGADKNRQILPNSKVKSSEDFEIRRRGMSIKLELATDYFNYWSTKGCIDLRDDKYTRLKQSSSILLGISILDRYFFILDFRGESINADFIPHHVPYGYKPAYRIVFKETSAKFYELSKENMVEELLKIL